MKSFDVLTGDQEVCTATYRPETDQSQNTKSVSHKTIDLIIWLTDFMCCDIFKNGNGIYS